MELQVCTKPVTSMENGDFVEAKGKCVRLLRQENGDWKRRMEVSKSQTNNNNG